LFIDSLTGGASKVESSPHRIVSRYVTSRVVVGFVPLKVMKRDDINATTKLALLMAASAAVSAVSLYLLLLSSNNSNSNSNTMQRSTTSSADTSTSTSTSTSRQTGGETAQKKASPPCIYLDYNGTTPIYPEVYQAMKVFFETHFGNPGSAHCFGDEPRQAVAAARRTILAALCDDNYCATTTTGNGNGTASSHSNSDSSSIIFCACGTEADNLAIHLALQPHINGIGIGKNGGKPPHVVTTNVEHPAVAKCLEYYERGGICTVTYVPVEPDGCVTTSKVVAAIRPNT
jgi:cysteine desulfurase